jgi:LPXTG-motif cell wall-anchored protein
LLAWVKNETSATATALNGWTLDSASTSYLWAEYGTALSAGAYEGHFSYDASIGWQTAIVGLKPADTTPPTGTIAINSGANYTNTTSITLILSCSDSGCGCSEMQFSNDNSNWSTHETYSASKSWSLSSGDGTKTVYAKFKDAAGNWSDAYSDTIVLDKSAPISSASIPGGTYPSAQNIILNCNDSGSGCDKIYYTTNGLTPTTSSSVYSSPINISSNTTLKFFAVDVAGNQETTKSETYTITTNAINTPVGLNVSVDLGNGVQVTFAQVAVEGSTTLTIVSCASAPPGFRFLGTCFDINTTASYIAPITLTLPYNEASLPNGVEPNLRLFHGENGGWVDVMTMHVNAANNTITGQVNSLSPFGIGFPWAPYVGPGPSTGANTNMIAFIALIAITAGLFIIRKRRWIKFI